MPIRTLPAVVLRLELHMVTATRRAEHLAIRPTAGNHVVAAVFRIGEVNHGFLESGRFSCRGLSVPDFHGIVKYIYTGMFADKSGAQRSGKSTGPSKSNLGRPGVYIYFVCRLVRATDAEQVANAGDLDWPILLEEIYVGQVGGLPDDGIGVA
jgi:hypothetical protein